MSDSERARWLSISAQEQGGFGGLRRVASLHRDELPRSVAAAIESDLHSLRADPPTCAAPYPDQQTVQLCVRGVRPNGAVDEWTLTVDTGDTPPALGGLLERLRFVPDPGDR